MVVNNRHRIKMKSFAVSVSGLPSQNGGKMTVPVVEALKPGGLFIEQIIDVKDQAPPCDVSSTPSPTDPQTQQPAPQAELTSPCVSSVDDKSPSPGVEEEVRVVIPGLDAEVKSLGIAAVNGVIKVDKIECSQAPLACSAKYMVAGSPVSKKISDAFSKVLTDTYKGQEIEDVVCSQVLPPLLQGSAALPPGAPAVKIDVQCTAKIDGKKP